MNNTQLEILQITQAMFNAAPGSQFLSEFTAIVDNANGSTNQLANVLAATDVFKQSMYADTLTNKEFSTQFVENIVGTLVSAENKTWAALEIEGMLDAGQSRGDVIQWAATALSSVDTTNADWGAAALQFNNKVDVASFYSIDQSGSASTLSILQQVTADVTNIAASVNAAKVLFESGVSGKVIDDGYVSDATVFVDLNGNGVLNAGEVITTTDALGNFTFSDVSSFGNLIVSGGTDISTSNPLEGVMTAPAGSSVVNPLTTLIINITQDNRTTVDQATEKVLTSLGLDADVDLLKFDPIAETTRTDIDVTATGIALAIQAAAINVNTLISLNAALLSGAGVSIDEDAGIDLAYETLAALLVSTTNTADLASSTVIAQMIQDATVKTEADNAILFKVGALLTDASETIANLNTAINTAVTSNSNTSSALAQIAAIQIVAENVEAAIAAGAATGDVSSTTTSTTNTALSSAIATASSTVGDVTGDGTSNATAPSSSEGEDEDESEGGGSGGGGSGSGGGWWFLWVGVGRWGGERCIGGIRGCGG